jgi:anti-sigma regulatory factor (Ser/Thr protein kinase)
MLQFQVLNSAFKGKTFPFKDGLTIGSGEGAVLRAQHPDIRPLHARLSLAGGRPVIELTDTTGRMLHNSTDVVRAELRHHDEVTIGPLRLRVLDTSRASQVQHLDQLLSAYEESAGDQVYDFAKEDLFYLVNKDAGLKRALSFVIPSKDKFLEQAQSFLARLVKGTGMEEEKVDGFMTVLKELILNAHRHGHKFDESKQIVVRWRDLGDRVQVVIKDQGPGFDHRAVVSGATAKDAASAARERYLAGGFGGLGFQLIVRLADELRYNDAGNEVTFAVKKKADV